MLELVGSFLQLMYQDLNWNYIDIVWELKVSLSFLISNLLRFQTSSSPIYTGPHSLRYGYEITTQ